MAQPQARIHTICDDCVNIFTDAASLLTSKSAGEPATTLFNARYQARLACNVSSSKCDMCMLLSASIPKLLEAFDPKEIRGLAISSARHDPDAVTVGLFGFERETLDRQTYYPGSLRIQDDVMPAGSGHVWPIEELGPEEFNFLSLKALPNVRIVSSSSLLQDTLYLTLSHRWGNPPSVLLSKKTLFLLDDDISRHLLDSGEAAVFRHAIHVARCLGFRYIWIDALCIMQDDGPEKTAEIMKMDEIYLNSSLNISATEGRIREGLVFDRAPLRINPCRATVIIPQHQGDVHLQAFPDKCFLLSSEGPLNKRGWVFQERVLAPRIAHFTADQVFWECHSLEASEVLPRGLPAPPSAHADRGVGIFSASSVQQVKSRWYDLVEAYSHTSLTFADDRLLAISAVARRCCAAMRLEPSEYLAGMWRDDLPLSMLWSQNPHSDTSMPEPTASIGTEMKKAPSWSWASVLASVQSVEPFSLVATAEVLRVQIARASPDFFDGADSCILRLRGRLCKSRRVVQDGLPWIHVGQHTKFQEFGNFTFQKDRVLILMWDRSRAAGSGGLQASSGAPVPSTYYFLHVASERSVDGPIERGIVLRRAAARGTYARIGAFFTPPKSPYLGSELEDAFGGRLHTLSADDYLELGSEGKYTIDVVPAPASFKVTLHDYLVPELFVLTPDIVDKELRPRQVEVKNSPYLPPGVWLNEEFLNDLETWTYFYDPAGIVLSFACPEDALFKPPQKVLIDNGRTASFFKLCYSIVQITTELRAYKKLTAANLDPQLRICRLHGVVMDDGGLISGLLLSYIDHGGLTMSCRVGPDEPSTSVRAWWASQLDAAITELHKSGVVWGDVKAENVLVDQDNNAWITDFGGGYTEVWVDKRVAWTVEGDLAGMAKLREFIFQDEAQDSGGVL